MRERDSPLRTLPSSKKNFSSCTSKSNKFLSRSSSYTFFLLLSQNLKRVGKYSHKSFLHCSLCVTNFHYGFRAININKRKKRENEERNPIFLSGSFLSSSSSTSKTSNCNRSRKIHRATLLQPRINVTFVTKFFNTLLYRVRFW